jgi:hypothetical protein
VRHGVAARHAVAGHPGDLIAAGDQRDGVALCFLQFGIDIEILDFF